MKNRWFAPAAVFAAVLLAQLGFVALAGNDIPFYDQWDVEGSWLYPGWRDGSVHLTDLLRAHNEHRIFWTHLLNLGLFNANGQWDPLVQLAANAVLHASVAAILVIVLGRSISPVRRTLIAVAVLVFSLPLAGWHNALWGFQSQVYFSLLFGVPALWLLTEGRQWSGAMLAVGAMLAMGSGALVPAALLLLWIIRALESRRLFFGNKAEPVVSLMLLAAALLLRGQSTASLEATNAVDFLRGFMQLLAWPHPEQPWAALVLNLPLMIAVLTRVLRRRVAAPAENAVLALALWAILIAAAVAWSRGGGDELRAGVPSRYVDFLMLLPLANIGCVCVLLDWENPRLRWAAVAWAIFLSVGWLGCSYQMWRRIVQPLMRNRDVPVHLIQIYQRTRDPAVFAGQPRLWVPHPNLPSIDTVLNDPRLRGALPPSLQPEREKGPLSRVVREVLAR